MTIPHRLLIGLATLSVSLAACDRPSTLWPSPATSPVAGIPQTEQHADAGIRITAAARPGSAAAAESVTPLWLSVENDRRSPVLIDRSSLRLVASDGTVYRALPVTGRPAETTGEPESVHPVPTTPATGQAMPAGAVLPGGRAAGWVYFEQVSPGTDEVALQARIEDPVDGSLVTKVRIPFDVAR